MIPFFDERSVLKNYLDNSWDQVMAWRNDGRYNIDNSEAERNIRPMTIERSNSKSFGSHEGVEISAVYHTIIATCKAQAVSVCEYLKQFSRHVLMDVQIMRICPL